MENLRRNLAPFSTHAPQESVAGPTLWRRFHRHMRGRYVLGIALGMALGLGGAYYGYTSAGPSYKSTGCLRITPLTLKVIYNQDVASSIFDSFVDVQINFMRSRPVIKAVLDNEKWLQAHPDEAGAEPEIFLRNLEITHQPHSELVELSFTDRTPLGAQAGASLLIDSYMRINGDQSSNQRIEAMQKREIQLKEELAAISKKMGEITQKYGTEDLKQIHQSKVLELSRLEAMIMETELNLVLAESAIGKSDPASPTSLPDSATTDELLRKLWDDEQQAQAKLTELEQSHGKDHPEMVAAKTNLEILKTKIKAHLEVLQKSPRSTYVNNPTTAVGTPTPASLEAMRQRHSDLKGLYEKSFAKSLDIGSKSAELVELQAEYKKTSDQLTETQKKIEELNLDSSIIGLISVMDHGDLPRIPAKDQHRKLAALGAFCCFGLGFGLIGSWSFTDRRLRRSADIAIAGVDLPIIGTFPQIPSMRHAGASEIASALHQTLAGIQIDPQLGAIRVFAVSSASQDEGKTEMAAALAVGFAALGKRTLLVDFDLRNAELTRRLTARGSSWNQNKSGDGLVDVLSGESLRDCCQRTHLDQVSFLPMGSSASARIGSLTSDQVRAVLSQAAAAFDIVILDTPPILSGLESILICKEAESLLLAATPSTSDRVFGARLPLSAQPGLTLAGCSSIKLKITMPAQRRSQTLRTWGW